MNKDDRQFVGSVLGRLSKNDVLAKSWVLDDRFANVVMRVVGAVDLKLIWPQLDALFAHGYQEELLSTADSAVRRVVDLMGGLRGDQYFFVTASNRRERAFLAVWPWQNAPQASLRLGFIGVEAFDLSLFDELLKQ